MYLLSSAHESNTPSMLSIPFQPFIQPPMKVQRNVSNNKIYSMDEKPYQHQ